MASEQDNATLPERRAGAPPGEAGQSKNALKKAAKEREKAEKAAKRKAEEEKQKQDSAANDVSAGDYGELPMVGSAEYKDPMPGVKRITLRELAAKYQYTSSSEEEGGPEVLFSAVAENARVQSAKLAFLVLGKGMYSIQAVVAASETLSRQMVKFAGSIPAQSSVLVRGVVRKPKEDIKSATISNLEIHVRKIYIEAKAESPLPIQVEDCERPIPAEGAGDEDEAGKPIVSLATRLNNRTIDLAARINQAIFMIKSEVAWLFMEFLRNRNFIMIHTPKILSAPTEGGSSVFELKYFERKAYLAQSPQLYKQAAIQAHWPGVYEVGPVFRAENSNTARHLTEFVGLDMEMEFEEDYHEVVDVLEELMLYIFKGLREKLRRETEMVRRVYGVEDFRIPEGGEGGMVPRLRFVEGIAMLREAGARKENGEEISEFEDLTTTHEKLLGRLVLEKYNTDFYILDQFPLAARPFYTMPSSFPNQPPSSTTHPSSSPSPNKPHNDPPSTADQFSNSYDFFMRGQEILSGAQRIHFFPLLLKRMRSMTPPVDPNAEGLKQYVEGFKRGCRQHAGGGVGLERVVMLWLGLPNVRLASLFPRDPGRVEP